MKIYISPARHPDGQNLDVHGRSERDRMAVIGGKFYEQLAANGFTDLMINDDKSLADAVAESNTWGADLHIALHSNASNGLQSGMEAWIYRDNLRMEVLARHLMSALTRALQTRIRNGSRGWAKRSRIDPPWVRPRFAMGMYEVERTKGDAILLELYFHDNLHDCATWKKNEDRAVAAMAQVIAEYAGRRE